jgi:hypothetical protein
MGENRAFFDQNRAVFRLFFSTESPFSALQFDIGSLITRCGLPDGICLYYTAITALIAGIASPETGFI